MTFVRYQHIEHVDSDNTAGLLDGTCHVFPKMDGANGSVFVEDGDIRCASRKMLLDDGHPMTRFVKGSGGIVRLLSDHPQLRLYGEWMVPHTVRDYDDRVWNRFLVFDVVTDTGELRAEVPFGDGRIVIDYDGDPYLGYDEYAPLLDAYGVDYVPLIRTVDHPTREILEGIADTGSGYMMPPGQAGEGIVVKRYGYRNPYGHETWGKVLSTRFRDMPRFGARASADKDLEREIADRSVTSALVEKEYARIAAETGGHVHPARLSSTVWRCVVEECLWDEIKRNGNPVIDFGKLRSDVDDAVRRAKPDAFGGMRDAEARWDRR